MTAVPADANARTRRRADLFAAAIIGAIASVDNLGYVLAMTTLLFSGTLLSGLGPGFGTLLLGAAMLAVVVAMRSGQPNAVAVVQETTVPLLSSAVLAMTMHISAASNEQKVVTALGYEDGELVTLFHRLMAISLAEKLVLATRLIEISRR